ncbi:F0F1 ATP synthase subunit delta [Candidatus Daviesbacteria bacterium]|nr:F0F1 ATP synthase subunit delta [Candidatus Daviesbacteria bacterium]
MTRYKNLQKLAEICVGECCKEGQINAQKVGKVLRQLKSLPTDQAIFTISEFLKGIKRKKSEYSLIVESASPLSRDEITKLGRLLRSKFVFSDIKNEVNPALLGGLRLKIGDQILDYSLQSKINQLEGVMHD